MEYSSKDNLKGGRDKGIRQATGTRNTGDTVAGGTRKATRRTAAATGARPRQEEHMAAEEWKRL